MATNLLLKKGAKRKAQGARKKAQPPSLGLHLRRSGWGALAKADGGPRGRRKIKAQGSGCKAQGVPYLQFTLVTLNHFPDKTLLDITMRSISDVPS